MTREEKAETYARSLTKNDTYREYLKNAVLFGWDARDELDKQKQIRFGTGSTINATFESMKLEHHQSIQLAHDVYQDDVRDLREQISALRKENEELQQRNKKLAIALSEIIQSHHTSTSRKIAEKALNPKQQWKQTTN